MGIATRVGMAGFGLLVVSSLLSCGPTGGDVPPSGIEAELTQTTSTEHFDFHYVPGDSVDAPRTEAFYAWISQRLSIVLPAKIQYYKFSGLAQKQRLTGIGGYGHAKPWSYGVFTVWPWDNHEITHVFTYRVGYPPDLFNEGMAVANQVDPLANSYTPTWNMVPLHTCAAGLLAAGKLPAFSDVLGTDAFRAVDSNVTYPMAGSFVEYLIEQYSVPLVLQLFPAKWNDAGDVTRARFEQLFGASLESAERDWHSWLPQSP